MTGNDFKLAMKNPKNIYILVSTDSEMIDLYVNRFKNAIHIDDISYGQIKSYGKLFKKKVLSVVYMHKIDIDIFKRQEYIFIYTDSIDKRSAIYKQHKDQIIELKNDYTKYIMNNSDLDESSAKFFAKAHNNDLGAIKNSLTLYKESDYTYNRFTNYSSDLYLWIEKFIKKEKLPKLIDESPISVMALLSTNCQNILRIKNNDIVDMNPYIIKCMNDLVSYRSNEELYSIIGDCFYLDCQIKKGLIDINDVINYLIIKDYK